MSTIADNMRRGAQEANAESHAAAMGRAIGELTAFARAIFDLTARIESLEREVADLKAAKGPKA